MTCVGVGPCIIAWLVWQTASAVLCWEGGSQCLAILVGLVCLAAFFVWQRISVGVYIKFGLVSKVGMVGMAEELVH